MKKLALFVLLSNLISFSVRADDYYNKSTSDGYAGMFYAGVDIASANYGGTFFPSTTGINFLGGYNITSQLAIEAGYAMMSSTSSSCNYGCGYGYGGSGYYNQGYGNGYGYGYAPPQSSYSFNTSTLQIALVATLPITDEISVSAKYGFDNNSMNYDSTDNVGNPLPTISDSQSNHLYGIGGQYNLGQGVILRLQYEDLGYITAGVRMSLYSFGGTFNF